MDRIIRAAEEEFKLAGYSGATTAAIARRAEVTEAQLFRYFASKSELFREAIFTPLNRHFTDFLTSQLGENGNVASIRKRTRQYITELQDFLSDHSKMLMSLVVAQTYAPETMQGVGEIDSLSTYFERGAATMSDRIQGKARVDPALMVRASFAAVLAGVMFKDWIFPPGLASDEEIRAAIIDFVIDGINANGGRG
ncbi:MAG: TetR/AcrR family transcriptional regulator [Sphingobium sp.]